VSDLLTRTLTAVLVGTVALFAIWYGSWVFFILIALMVGLSTLEWAAIAGTTAERHRIVDLKTVGIPVFGVLAALAAMVLTGLPWLGGVLLACTVVAVIATETVTVNPRSAETFKADLRLVKGLGPGYIGLAGVALIWMRDAPEHGAKNVALVMLCVWATDIGAYFAGRRIGGPKLAPSISPAKTWSGLGGGVIASMAVAGGLHIALGGHSVLLLLGAAAALAVIAQGGDLLESSLKRRFGVKDSGQILPGHGGILDRVDGLLASASVMAFFIAIFGSGTLWL